MAKIMEQYMCKTRTDYVSGVARPKIENKDQFKLGGQFIKELRENTFSGSDHEDANEHIEKVLEIVDYFKRPFLSTAHANIDVYKRKITLRVGDEKIIFKSVKPASNLIKRVYMLSLKERMELDLEDRLMGETLEKNRSLDPINFVVLEDMNAYHDEGMGDVIVGEPFLREVRIKARWFEGTITLYKGIAVIMEYLVKISKKARILELKRRYFEEYYSDNQYAVSIKEDMTYLCLHFTKEHEGNNLNMSYPEKTNTPYWSSTGPIGIPGQKTTLPHAFATRTLHNPTTGAWNMDTGNEVLRRLVSSNFISWNKEKPLVLCHACQLGKHQNAMRDEYTVLLRNKTWSIVPRPSDANIMRCMWLFCHKYLADGKLSRYKTRLVANGSTQLEGVDVDNTFNLVVKLATIQIVLSLAVSRHQPIHQLDVKNAFLHGFFLSQKKYAMEILDRAHMDNCNPIRTSIDTDSKLRSDGDPVSDLTLYRSIAGSPQHLTFTRTDISYAAQQVCLYMHDPREPYFLALKRILRYIRGTLDFGLQLLSSFTTDLVAYSNADWAACLTTRRTTSGYCIFLGNNLLSWSSKHQPTLSRSSAEAKYHGVANAVAETCCLRNLLRQTTSCPMATKEDQLKCRNAINKRKLKKQGKRQHDEAIRSEDGHHFLSSKECSGEAHISEYIYEYVDACNQEVGAEHVVQVVTDNASNNMGAAALLKVTRPKIFWTSCATYTINLFLKVGYDEKILDQAKKLTIFIYSHHKTLALMRDFTKKRDIVRPGVTRFTSSFLTLQRKATYATVLSTTFWACVSLCLKVFTPLVKVLRMVDADWKPSMGFVYGEMIKGKEEIKGVLGGNKKAYEHKNHREEDESNTCRRFRDTIASDKCGDAKIHTKKRNRLEACKLNNLIYVQFNSNLTEKAKRRKARDVEVLLSNDSNMAQEWIVECDGDGNRNRDEEVEVQDQQDQEAQWEVIGEAMEADEYPQPRQSSRTTTKTTQRELFDEEFKSGSEEVVYEEGDYESDGVKIIEGYGDED
nr:ribonuclease H-like domain-containing protein [Tanacetum cinerariifolium]